MSRVSSAGCWRVRWTLRWGQIPKCADVDGVLFNKERAVLIRCPARKSGTYVVPETVTAIESSAFSDSSLAAVDMPDGVTNVGGGAFARAVGLRRVGLPSGLMSLGGSAFSGCTNLLSLSIPDGVAAIETYTFFRCSGLTNIQLGSGVRTIGNSAFGGCSGLTRFEIPEGVTHVEPQAFMDCSRLRSVTVGKGVVEMGYSMFVDCLALEAVYFSGNPPGEGFGVFHASATVYYLPQSTGWGPTWGGRPAVLWNPTVQPGVPGFGVEEEGFGFVVTGTPNIPLRIVASGDPSMSGGTTARMCVLTNGAMHFTDPDWTNYPARFYRIESP